MLDHGGRDPVAAPLALGITALILFVISNVFPLLEFGLSGQHDTAYLLAGIRQLYAQPAPLLASVVLFTTVLAPLLHIALLIYIYLPLQFGRRPPAFVAALRLVQRILPWSMLEIFLLGVLVAAVKLAEQATIVGASAAIADAAQLHTTREVDGYQRMEQLTELPVAPGQSLEFAPGGTHIMLLGLARMPAVGDEVRLCLQVAGGGEVCTVAEVRKGTGGEQSHEHHQH